MHSRNQNKPPMTPAHNLSRIPSNKSEVLDDVQLDKSRKIGGGKMVGQVAYTRYRALQAAVNTIRGSRGVVPASESPNGDSTGGQLEFKSREDVEKLLAEKLNPKNRDNDKGRNKELRDNIKKFKACINWYMKLEDGYLAEQEKLRGILESEQRSHSEIETHMSSKIDELTLLNEEHQKHMLSLEESVMKEETDKLAAIEAYEKEAEAKITSENLRSGLLEELERATQEIKHLNDQIKMVQETNKWLQEYNTSLQQYIVKNGDTITKLQKDKTAMMETLSGLRDQSSSLKNQLDAIRLKDNSGKAADDFLGVPVFQSKSLALKSQGRSYRPAFFRKEDLEDTLFKASRDQGQFNPSFRKGNIEVSVLEEIISAMKGSSTSDWDDIVFIPPGFEVETAVRKETQNMSS